MTGWAVPGLVHVGQVAVDAVGRRVLARHRMNRRVMSVTYLSPEFRADTEFRNRFVIESERLAQVRDASLARVHQYVECGDDAAIVADHVEGMPLRALLLEEGALRTEAAVVVFKDALRGLWAGHCAGVAHGDLKPEHVVLTHAGRVRLVEFGLYTRAGRRLLARSSPFYLAPEQWRGTPASASADLYAVTAIFFECLVGAPPFHGDSPAALAALHEYGTPPLDAVPAPVRELMRAGLAKSPAVRPDARLMLTHVEEAAVQGLGPGWERRGRRELADLLVKPAHPADLPAAPVPADHGGRIRHVRLAAVLGGALVLAAGLSSPPLPSVLLPGPSEVSGPDEATPPVMAFPGTPNGTAGSSTNGKSAAPGGSASPQSAALASPSGPNAGTTLGAPLPPSGSAVDQGLSRPASPAPIVPTPRTIPSSGVPLPAPFAGSHAPVAPSAQPKLPKPSAPEQRRQPGPRVVQAGHSDDPGSRKHQRQQGPRTYSGGGAGGERAGDRDDKDRDDKSQGNKGGDNKDRDSRNDGRNGNAGNGSGGDRVNCDERGADNAPTARRTSR
ncbi:MAG TPA: protein kinase [Pseudonocardiaceae bacterium]|nr:protein kinase [Pseudonocardiaceae bacterium]